MGVAEKQLKVVVVGDAFVGKTSLLFAYTQNTFEGNYSTTVFNNWAVTVTVNQRQCTVNLFDTAGQEDLASIRCLSYPQTDVFLLCFSLIDRNTLDNCRNLWMPEIRRFVSTEVPVLLVGTKEDLIENSSPELLVDVQRAAEIGAIGCLSCSALTHRGLKRVFDTAILAALGVSNGKKSRDRDCCHVM